VIPLKNAAGAKYSNWEQQPEKSIDPEELRTIKTNSVVWSSEGARVISKDFSVLQHPAIQTATVNGNFVNRFDLPANLNMQKRRKGPRNNGVLGITFNKTTGPYTALKNRCMKMTARLL
jgi:hypothetical protein